MPMLKTRTMPYACAEAAQLFHDAQNQIRIRRYVQNGRATWAVLPPSTFGLGVRRDCLLSHRPTRRRVPKRGAISSLLQAGITLEAWRFRWECVAKLP